MSGMMRSRASGLGGGCPCCSEWFLSRAMEKRRWRSEDWGDRPTEHDRAFEDTQRDLADENAWLLASACGLVAQPK